MRRVEDLIGRTFSRLTVIGFCGKRGKRFYWVCECVCGGKCEVEGTNLRVGHTQSCGCYAKEQTSKARLKHGYSTAKKDKLYWVFASIKTRCYNKNSKSYSYYGGLGISICDEWLKDFTLFRDWALRHGWTKGMNICRKGDIGNYSPDNCYIATSRRNQQDRRGNVINMWKARVIRRMFNNHNWSQKKIAEFFGIAQDTTHLIVRNKTWNFPDDDVQQERKRIISEFQLQT